MGCAVGPNTGRDAVDGACDPRRPVAELAERARRCVDIVLKVYAELIEGLRETANQRIEADACRMTTVRIVANQYPRIEE